METPSLNIVIFPWLAFGHMLPFLELSKSLAKKGHHITYISTRRNIQRLPPLPPELSLLINFKSVQLPHVEHLPENAESTMDLPPNKVCYLKQAFDGLKEPIRDFLESACTDKITKPDCIIIDFCHHWVPKIAQENNVPCCLFYVFAAWFQVFLHPLDQTRTNAEHFTIPPKWVPFPSNLAYRLHETKWVLDINTEATSGMTDMERVIPTVRDCTFISVRSCFELEPEWIPLLAEINKKPVIPVGFLPPSAEHSPIDINMQTNLEIVDWLDKQPLKSVVYIAFGSEASLSIELLHELALGLEISGVLFLWALRNQPGVEMLPEGFELRTKGVGLVVGWAPQKWVLAHRSVGGFLTHCGWSSVIEGLLFGQPLIMLPIFCDQGLIARILGEKGVGVEVPRDGVTGSFKRDEVAKVVQSVMVGEEGKVMKRNARQLKDVISDIALQEKYVDDLVVHIRRCRED